MQDPSLRDKVVEEAVDKVEVVEEEEVSIVAEDGVEEVVDKVEVEEEVVDKVEEVEEEVFIVAEDGVEEVVDKVEEKVEEEVIRVNVALLLTVLAGLLCAASGVTVRLQTSPMVTRMLANAHHPEIVHHGHPHAPSLDTARLVAGVVGVAVAVELHAVEEVLEALEAQGVQGVLEALGVVASVAVTRTAPLPPPTAPSLATAGRRSGTPMGGTGPRLTLMRASAM